MSISLGLAIYFICWWLVLFMVLPIGVKTQQETGDIIPGTAESAPTKPMIIKKMVLTTILAGLFFALVYWVITTQPIAYEDIPFVPKF